MQTFGRNHARFGHRKNSKEKALEKHIVFKGLCLVAGAGLEQNGGIPIAVYDQKHTEKWGNAFQFVANGRVSNLHSANYKQGSDLTNFLSMAVRSLAERIAVSASSYQG